ncbi:hypothetical protein [Pelovirga terrestris]|uniref:hypothetical protein n=1 Tax=Pelovirga terrestris TaxID=2771352 RepID=UPI001CD0DB59|nr:hypothetical protein [Pelovirga terrestris]
MKKILIVEDDPKDELLIRRALKNSGLINPIVVANDGEGRLMRCSRKMAAKA